MARDDYEEGRVLVRVVCGESVTERGVHKTVWLKREGASWLPLTSEQAQPMPEHTAPGTIWETNVEALLRPGIWLLRVDSFPAPERRLDPMQYLRREARQTSRQVLRRYYRVQKDGSLLPGKPNPAEIDSE